MHNDLRSEILYAIMVDPRGKHRGNLSLESVLLWSVTLDSKVAKFSTFQRDMLNSSAQNSILKIEVGATYETLISAYQTTRRHTQEDGNLHNHCCENHISQHFQLYLMLSSQFYLYPVGPSFNLKTAVLNEVCQIILLFFQPFGGTVYELKPATTAFINVLANL